MYAVRNCFKNKNLCLLVEWKKIYYWLYDDNSTVSMGTNSSLAEYQ